MIWYLWVVWSNHDIWLMGMNRHRRISVVSRWKLLRSYHVLEIEDNNTSSSQNYNLWFFGIKANALEDATSFNEVGLSGSLTEPMDGNHLVFLHIVWRHSHKIVTFCLLEFNMSHICFQFEADSQPLSIFFTIVFVVCPTIDSASSCLFGLADDFLCFCFCIFGVFPDHKFNVFSMSKGNYVRKVPINAENGFCVFSLPKGLAGLSFPDND